MTTGLALDQICELSAGEIELLTEEAVRREARTEQQMMRAARLGNAAVQSEAGHTAYVEAYERLSSMIRGEHEDDRDRHSDSGDSGAAGPGEDAG